MPTLHSAQTGRGNQLFLIAAAAIVIATGLMLIMNRPSPDTDTIEVVETTGTVERTPPSPAPEPATEPEAPAPVVTPQATPDPLPALDASDPEVHGRLLAMSSPELKPLLANEALLRKFVVLVDNLARGKIAPRYNPLNAPSGTFTVQGMSVLHANPEGFLRYKPYVTALTAINVDTLAAFYWHYYPLLQQAYVDLGYPRAQFHPRMLAALDMLIAAPQVPENAELVQPKVLYQYADPKLENLPAAQKQLMRMGPENQAAIQQYLKGLRTKLAAQ